MGGIQFSGASDEIRGRSRVVRDGFGLVLRREDDCAVLTFLVPDDRDGTVHERQQPRPNLTPSDEQRWRNGIEARSAVLPLKQRSRGVQRESDESARGEQQSRPY
jgi:hypothetical protein